MLLYVTSKRRPLPYDHEYYNGTQLKERAVFYSPSQKTNKQTNKTKIKNKNEVWPQPAWFQDGSNICQLAFFFTQRTSHINLVPQSMHSSACTHNNCKITLMSLPVWNCAYCIFFTYGYRNKLVVKTHHQNQNCEGAQSYIPRTPPGNILSRTNLWNISGCLLRSDCIILHTCLRLPILVYLSWLLS